MPRPVKFLSLLLAFALPIFALPQDSKSSEQTARARCALLVVDAQVGVLSNVNNRGNRA